MNIRELAKDYAKIAFDEALENEDIENAQDYLHEVIDGCEHVIYYARAWNVVTDARKFSGYIDAGEEYLRELGMYKIDDDNDLDTFICRLSYAILYVQAQECLSELIDEVEDI